MFQRSERSLLALLTLPLLPPLAEAQGPAFETPGMARSTRATLGQTDRFSNEFNPAISFVFDLLGSYTAVDGPEQDGFDFELLSFELSGAGYVDPNVWAFATIVAGEEEIALDEAAVVYTGLGGHHELRAGRFFVDFGKQMQSHVHELRTTFRPLVLREYLGEELAGTGVQWDNWFAPSETVAVRYSIGVFQGLAAHGHGEEEHAGESEVEIVESRRKEIDELAYTARLTGFSDVGERGILQLGASARFLPSFAFEADGLEAEDLSNAVYGLDLTYGRSSEDGRRRWALGGEFLWNTGDLGAELVDPGTGPELQVLDDDAAGWYLFADYGWNPNHSAGLQWSRADLPEADLAEANEYDLYYTWHLTELSRLRFGLTFADVEDGDDALRFAIQFTNFLGVHAHGVNW